MHVTFKNLCVYRTRGPDTNENKWPSITSFSHYLCCSFFRVLHPQQLQGCWLKCSVWKPALKQKSKWALCYEWRFWENHGQFIPGTQAPVSLGFPWTPRAWRACHKTGGDFFFFFLIHNYMISVSGLSLPSHVLSYAQGSLWNAAKWYYLLWAGCCRLNKIILYIAQHRAHMN